MRKQFKNKSFWFCSKKIEVEISECGFVVWCHKAGLRRWVVDASTISIDQKFEISIQQAIEECFLPHVKVKKPKANRGVW